MKTYSFEKLTVWHDAKELTKTIYLATKNFPDEEKFGLTSQLRRAMVSVCCNISEGTSRISGKEKARFIEIAWGSLMEVLNCLLIANELKYLVQNDLDIMREDIDKVGNKLNALKRSFLS